MSADDDTNLPATASETSSVAIESSGASIGPYKLLEKIGEGGFGEVWLAEQRAPVKRRVALKIIKLGMDTKQVVARFEAERQALALMDHPNIAKVLDAGATELGRPYFVMEHVKGVPITQYCDREKLEAPARLGLFIKVCQAIQHAHQKGIIHRDIKPSNILVTMQDGAPVPKVIDFGIAKATQMELTEKTLHTQLHQFIGTPAYMSPEQAEMTGIDIDTRSDIYSLGVLLYELLTGATPFDTRELLSAGLDEMRRIIREREPLRPSTRVRQTTSSSESKLSTLHLSLATDLDWIVMKCLEKDRTRRYETANGLAADLIRHLNSEPVTARPPTTAYRLSKAWRRNRVALSAAMTLAATLIVGTIGTSFGLYRAERERAKASKAAQDQATANAAAQLARKVAEARALELETNAYFNLVSLAHREITSEPSNIKEAETLLNKTPPRLRDWEWHYLKRRRFADPMVFQIIEGQQIHGLAFSPDERYLALACGDGSVRIASPFTGEIQAVLSNHTGFAASVAFHPLESSWVASAGSDGQLKLVDWRKKIEIGAWPWSGSMDYGLGYAVAFSPNGQYLAAPDAGNFIVREVPSGRERYRLPGQEIVGRSIAFSPDGRRIATASDGGVIRHWDAETGGPIGKPLGEPGAPATSVTFTRDGKRVAALQIVGILHLWDVETGAKLGSYQMGNPPLLGLSSRATSDRLAVGGFDRLVTIMDPNSGVSSLRFREMESGCSCVSFSPSGNLLAASGRSGAVIVWNGTPLRGDEDQSVRTLSYPPNTQGQVWALAVSPDGRTTAYGGRSLDPGTNLSTAPLCLHPSAGDPRLPPEAAYSVTMFSLAFHPHRPLLASSGDSLAKNRVQVWDLERQQHAFFAGPFEETGPIFTVEFSRDGRWLAGAGRDRKLKIWDGATGRKGCILGEHSREIVKLAFSPDGQLLASIGNDDIVHLWDASRMDQPQHPMRSFPAKANGFADSIAFSPDSARLAICTDDDQATIHNLKHPEDRVILTSRKHEIASLAFSGDGRWIATGGADGAVEIWDARTAALRHTFKAHVDRVIRIRFARAPEGERLISGSHDGTVKFWDVDFLKPL